MISCLALLCALALQGCNIDVPRHIIGNWEAKLSYLTEFQYTMPGKKNTSAILNSCSDPAITSTLQCNGHGRCRDWNDFMPGAAPSSKTLSFCECTRDWADPECRTPRKSQVTAFVLSLFFGIFGADQFYLGYPAYGLVKLLSLGGAGIWYLFDLCRIGSSPVVTRHNFRLAADLPHFAFVLTVVTAMLFIGFVIAIRSIQQQRIKKAHELLLLRLDQQEAQEEQEEKFVPPKYTEPQYSMVAPPTNVPLRSAANFSGYGAVLPQTAPMSVARTLPPMTLLPSALPMDPYSVAKTLPPMTMPPAVSLSAVPAPVTRSFAPAPVLTLPPQNFAVQAPVVETLPPATQPRTMSMPLTEYSVPRAVMNTAPVNSVILPMPQGMSPATTMLPAGIQPVSSLIDMSSQVRPAPASPQARSAAHIARVS